MINGKEINRYIRKLYKAVEVLSSNSRSLEPMSKTDAIEILTESIKCSAVAIYGTENELIKELRHRLEESEAKYKELQDALFENVVPQTSEELKTIKQLRCLWGLIDQISIEQNGDTSQSEKIYFHLLVTAGIHTDVLVCDDNGLKCIKKKFRHYHILDEQMKKDRLWYAVRVCYKGVSTFTKKDMSKFIDTTLKYIAENGIELTQKQKEALDVV